jgi:hypothetical protein
MAKRPYKETLCIYSAKEKRPPMPLKAKQAVLENMDLTQQIKTKQIKSTVLNATT